MLNFYIFILIFYISMVCVLFFNTRPNSAAFIKYQTLQRQNLLKLVCTKHLFYHNFHITIACLVQLYVSWCATGILKTLNILQLDSIVGIFIISIIILLFLIKRILTITVANKSVLYL